MYHHNRDKRQAKGHGLVHEHGLTRREQTQTEGQHAAHKIIAPAVQLFALRGAGHLQEGAECHGTERPTPVTAVEQQSVNDVELQHQAEEPERPRPDNFVGGGQQVVHHQQLCGHIHEAIVVGAGGEVVYHEECGIAHKHHDPEFAEVLLHEGPGTIEIVDASDVSRAAFIFHHQSVGTQKQKQGHPIVAEERENMHGPEGIEIGQCPCNGFGIPAEELVFVFFDYWREPVTIVMQEDANDGNAAQGGALSTG